jgi:bacterioferritin-associated ferredoxin
MRRIGTTARSGEKVIQLSISIRASPAGARCGPAVRAAALVLAAASSRAYSRRIRTMIAATPTNTART